MRLARARLALSRAVTLLAQHIGLGTTDLREIEARRLANDGALTNILDGVFPVWLKQLFHEGLQVIDSSLAMLTSHRPIEDGLLDHCEVHCATIAARGELFY